MKRKIKIWYPIVLTNEKEIEIDVPEDTDVNNYLYENAESILKQNGADEDEGLLNAIEYGYAGVKILK